MEVWVPGARVYDRGGGREGGVGRGRETVGGKRMGSGVQPDAIRGRNSAPQQHSVLAGRCWLRARTVHL